MKYIGRAKLDKLYMLANELRESVWRPDNTEIEWGEDLKLVLGELVRLQAVPGIDADEAPMMSGEAEVLAAKTNWPERQRRLAAEILRWAACVTLCTDGYRSICAVV